MLIRIEFGGWAPNCHCKNIGGFRFGGLVRDCHVYSIGKDEILLADFNLVVAQADCQTTKFNSPPNFLATGIKYVIVISRARGMYGIYCTEGRGQ